MEQARDHALRAVTRNGKTVMDESIEFTKQFLRSKSPCAMGFRWFVRNVEDGVSYQKALDTASSRAGGGMQKAPE